MNAEDIRELLEDQDMEELQKLEKKLMQFSDTGAVIQLHREQSRILEELEEAITGLNSVYDSTIHDREPLEDVYTTKMDLLFGMARRFHPLSEYGREMLERAISCRMDFEELAGPLVTRITADNAGAFDHLLSPDLLDEVIAGKSRALGALRAAGNDVYSTGAVVFSVETAGLHQEEVLRLKWLYVDENWRGRGIANALLGELVHFVSKEHMAAMTADLYVDDRFDLLGNLLASWHFLFVGGLSPEFAVALRDITDRAALQKYEDKVTSLLDLSGGEGKRLFRDYLSGAGYQGYLSEKSLPEDYIEGELSTFAGRQTNPTGLLLAHRCPSGKITIEYSHMREGAEDQKEEMLGALMLTALYKYDKSAEVVMPESMTGDLELLGDMFAKQRGQYLVEGILTPPDEAFRAKDVANIISMEEEG